MPETQKVNYESRDFNPRAVAWFTVSLAIVTVLVLLGMLLLMWALSRREIPRQGLVTPGPVTPLPIDRSPQPDLQITPLKDLQELRKVEDAQLGNYGWIDRQGGVAAIPIDRAMDILAKRGLKAQGPETPAAQPVQPTKEAQ